MSSATSTAVVSSTTRANDLIKAVVGGTPSERKIALRQLETTAASLANETFAIVLPILRGSESLERHRASKIVRKVLLSSKHKSSQYAREIMEAIQPMLVDPTHLTRREGRELLSALSNSVGMPTMFVLLREDLEKNDELVPRATAATIGALAPLSLEKVLAFVCAAAKSSNFVIRSTALRAISEICRVIPGAILVNLPKLVAAVKSQLGDNHPQCRIQACATLTGLATACSPFGIEVLEQCIPNLWAGSRTHKGRGLASYIRALAALMPLMDPESAVGYSHSVLKLCRTNFQSPDDETKKAILRAVAKADMADTEFLKELTPEFFTVFWSRRLALDNQAAQLVVEATKTLAQAGPVLHYVVETNALKDSSPFQKVALEALTILMTPVAMAATPERVQEQICDGLVTALKVTKTTDRALVSAFASFFSSMGQMLEPYLEPLVETITESFNSPFASQRELAGLLTISLAPSIRLCNQERLLVTLGTILNEQFGDESPQVLTAVLKGMGAICNVVGLSAMQPPVGDILPRLTPILRNKDDDISQACITLIGEIAQRGPEYANAREWMRICNELIELFKAPRKSVRRLANTVFGYVAKGIGPQDVLASLLTTMKLERQSRVNSAVAVAIVADACEPYAVLPALLNEYRTLDINVQHGVLKALSFVFEYTCASDYLFSMVSLVDHALTSKNQVHRQTGASIVKHLALKDAGRGHEDVYIHFLNELWPHIFETSPHVIDRINEAVQAVVVTAGAGAVLPYIWAGLFHPAKKTREVYWSLYNDIYVQSAHCMPSHYPVQTVDVWF